MSLKVLRLNADASLQLSFFSGELEKKSPELVYTILLDPWLSGKSTIWHDKFSITRLNAPSPISSLRDVPVPDLVLISQDKSDHCNEETLRELDPNHHTEIYAAQGGASVIKSWNHFRQEKVHSLKDWEKGGKSLENVLRIPIDLNDPKWIPGEIQVLQLDAPAMDISKLHTSIAIVYTPPRDSAQTNPIKAISIFYSPHGPCRRSLKPLSHYLSSIAALPLTLLFHSFDKVENPRILGGVVAGGAIAGAKVARELNARYIMATHDAEKVTAGFATTWVKTKKFEQDELMQVLGDTEIIELDAGQDLTINS
jgi:hypothetical protein